MHATTRILSLIVFSLLWWQLRVGAFTSAHSSWHEIIQQALMFKLTTQSTLDYTLGNITIRQDENEPAHAVLTKGGDNLTEALSAFFPGLYSTSLHWEPPAYPIVASLVGLLCGDVLTIIHQDSIRPGTPTYVQYGRVSTSLIFSGLTAVICFWLAKLLFDEVTAWIAVLLYIVNPLDVACSRLLLPDTLCAASFNGTLLLCVIAETKARNVVVHTGVSLAAALSATLMCLASTMGFVIIMGLLCLPLIYESRRWINWYAICIPALAASWWGWIIWEAHGYAICLPQIGSPQHANWRTAIECWRDLPLILCALPVLKSTMQERARILLYWGGLMYASFIVMGSISSYIGNEKRLLLTIYPCMIVLSASSFCKLMCGTSHGKWERFASRSCLLILFIVNILTCINKT